MDEDWTEQATTYRSYSEALYPALGDDPFYQTLEQSVDAGRDRKAAMLAYYDISIAEAARYGRICTAEGSGVSVWSLPLSAEEAAEKAHGKVDVVRAQMGPGALAIYEQINASMSQRTAPLIEAGDWYLSILGVLPAHQGQGRGIALMMPVLEEADRLGVASYLETYTPRNMRFYERLGYHVTGEVGEPVTGAPYWVMRRSAGGA